MKKKKFLIPLLLAALLAAVWTFLPRSFESALPGFYKKAEVTACYAVLVPAVDDRGIRNIDMPPDSAAYADLMERLHSTTYWRSPGDLLRLGQASNTQYIDLEPYYAHLYLRQGEQVFSATFYGNHMVMEQVGGSSRTYYPLAGTEFQQQMVEFLVAQRVDSQYKL